MYNIREYSDETMIEMCKSYKYLDVFDVGRGLLISNGFDIFGVHTGALSRDDQSYITDLGDVEFAFINVCL